MRLPMMFVAAIALAGCARQPAALPGSAAVPELVGRAAGRPQSCVASSPATNVRAIDAQTLAYGNGRTIFINHLSSPCGGLAPTSTIAVESHGGEFCRGDLVRGREMGAIIGGPTCVLSDWVPYTRP